VPWLTGWLIDPPTLEPSRPSGIGTRTAPSTRSATIRRPWSSSSARGRRWSAGPTCARAARCGRSSGGARY